MGIEKRVRFVISAVVMSFLFLISTFFFFDKAVIFIPILAISAYICTFFAVFEGIEKNEWFMLFILPVLLTVASYLFYFLFPVRWLTRIPFVLVYGVSIYAVMLSSNIFNVGVERNLQLYRAGFSVNYFLQTIVFFLFANVIVSFHWGFLANAFIFAALAFVFSLQLYWSIRLDLHISREVFHYALLTALAVGEVGILLSLMPIQTSIFALTVSVAYYCTAGLAHLYIDERLFKHSLREYTIILVVIGIIVLLSLAW